MAAVGQTAGYRDSKGNTATMRFFVLSTGQTLTQQEVAAAAVITAANALSNAFQQTARGPANKSPLQVTYGTNSTYAAVEDKAIFTFQTATGSIHRFQVPAPKASIFLADGETVDPANTDVVAFVAAVIANATDSVGNAIAFGANGTRIRRRTHRRLNIFVKDPTETIPAE